MWTTDARVHDPRASAPQRLSVAPRRTTAWHGGGADGGDAGEGMARTCGASVNGGEGTALRRCGRWGVDSAEEGRERCGAGADGADGGGGVGRTSEGRKDRRSCWIEAPLRLQPKLFLGYLGQLTYLGLNFLGGEGSLS